jgi:cyclophilin family peptidyl-prolyl cis-trans isomerase
MKSWSFASCVAPLLLSLLSAGAGTLAQFRTVFGDIEVELYDQQKPVTVQNFKRLVQSGAFQNTFFHRVEPGFVAQGGGYFTTIPFSATDFAAPWSFLGLVPNFGAITNEFNVGPRFSNTNGTIAMAKVEGKPDSATCGWFFNLANNSTNLDNQNGGFTVFGHVVRDTGSTTNGPVLGLFNRLAYGNRLLNMQWWYGTNDPVANLFQVLPVTYPGLYYPWYSDLLYVDISLLNVQVAVNTNGNREISWNSVSNTLNYVEFTTNFPPTWNLLASTTGDGTTLKVTDSSPKGLRRFYRVRVAY